MPRFPGKGSHELAKDFSQKPGAVGQRCRGGEVVLLPRSGAKAGDKGLFKLSDGPRLALPGLLLGKLGNWRREPDMSTAC
jgi:hypothetical protein